MTNEELVRAIQSGDCVQENMLSLYNSNRGMIWRTVERFSGYMEMDDLMQEAYICLWAAVNHFEEDRGANFLTYALKVIRRGIQRYIEGHTDAFSGVRFESIDADQYEGHPAAELIPDPEDKYAEALNRAAAHEAGCILWQIVSTLSKDEQDIIKTKYKKGYSWADVARAMNKPYNEVIAIKQKALAKMKTPRNLRRLEPFLDDERYNSGVKGVSLKRFRETGSSSTERAALRLFE